MSSRFAGRLGLELMIVVRAWRTMGCIDPNGVISYRGSFMIRYLCGLEVGTCRASTP